MKIKKMNNDKEKKELDKTNKDAKNLEKELKAAWDFAFKEWPI